MIKPEIPRWFADESVLGFGRLLARQRADVVFPGHPDLPNVALGATDEEWMPVVAARGWVAFHRDRRIRTRPAELTVFREAGLKAVWFAGRQDMSPSQQVELALRHWNRLERLATKLGRGPWAINLTLQGPREFRLPDQPEAHLFG